MGVQVDAVRILEALHFVALALLIEHVELNFDVRYMLGGLSQVVDHRQ